MRIVKNMDAKSGYHLLIIRTKANQVGNCCQILKLQYCCSQDWTLTKPPSEKKHVRKLLQPLCYCCTKNDEASRKVWELKAIANLSDSRTLITIVQSSKPTQKHNSLIQKARRFSGCHFILQTQWSGL